MVSHCRTLMPDPETSAEGSGELRALIDYMEGLIERLEERASDSPATRGLTGNGDRRL